MFSTIQNIWADGFVAPMDNVPLTTGAWITLRVTHNSTAPSAMKEDISGRNERELPRGLQGPAISPLPLSFKDQGQIGQEQQ
jgi:hypothetical protein